MALHPGQAVTGLEVGQGSARVRTREAEWLTPLVVGADGMHSTVRRLAGLKRTHRGRPRYGARLHYRLAPGAPLPTHVHVHLGEGLEYYLTPTGPREINAAILCEKEVTRTFRGDLSGRLRALVEGYPSLKDMHLVDYKVRIMPPQADSTGTDAVTRVVIESANGAGERWSTVGVSANIIDASYVALRDAYHFKLFRDKYTAE